MFDGRWTFDGNLEAPTFTPSLLVHGAVTHPRCHSFLKGGTWEFLSDCTHALKDQKVPLPDLPSPWA